MFMYRLMPELPLPPQWLIDGINFDEIPATNNVGGHGRRILSNWYGLSNTPINGVPARNVLRIIGDKFDDWVRENITDTFQRTAVNYVNGSTELHSTGVHSDQTRDYVLLYNLRTGGPNAELCFWQQEGYPLVRDRAVEIENPNGIKLVKSVKGPENCWYLINTRILHSTEKLSELRCNLQVAFQHTTPWTD